MNVDFSEFRKIVVAIDPATTNNENSDSTGICVVAHGPHQDGICKLMEIAGRCPGHGYILADLTCRLAPHLWAKRAIEAYDLFEADRIIAEVNNGGDMVGTTIHAIRAGVPYTSVNASRGKRKRAEPVSTLHEQGRLHFVGVWPELEDECTSWTFDAKWSPDRLDAMVWACSALGLIGGQGAAFIQAWQGATEQRAKRPVLSTNEREQKELARIIKMAPKHGTNAEKAPPVRCEHRWRGSTCVFCFQERASVQVISRGGLRG